MANEVKAPKIALRGMPQPLRKPAGRAISPARPAQLKEAEPLEQHKAAWMGFHDSVNRLLAIRKQGAPIGEREFGALAKEAKEHLEAIGGVVANAHREGVAERDAKVMRRDVQQVFSQKRREELSRQIGRLHQDGRITGNQREVIEGLLTKGGVLAGEHMRALDPKRQKLLTVHARSFSDMGNTFEGALKRMAA